MMIQILGLFLKSPPGWYCETVQEDQKCNEKLEKTSGRKKVREQGRYGKDSRFWYNKGNVLLLVKYAMQSPNCLFTAGMPLFSLWYFRKPHLQVKLNLTCFCLYIVDTELLDYWIHACHVDHVRCHWRLVTLKDIFSVVLTIIHSETKNVFLHITS